MRVLGYIKPPFTIIDFVETVYTDGINIYISKSENYLIKEFIIISQEVEIQILEKKIYKNIDNPEFYFYLDASSKEITGEFDIIATQLKSLLEGQEINLYAKLSIAQFLNLRGRENEIIIQIATLEKDNDVNTTLLKSKLSEINLKNDQDKKRKIFSIVNNLLNNYNNQIELDDLVLIERNNIHLYDYKISLYEFGTELYNSTRFFEEYFSKIPLSKKENIRSKNEYLVSQFFENRIELVLTKEEIDTIDSNVSVPYYMEEEMSNQEDKSPNQLSKSDKIKKQSMKNLVSKFEISPS